ncbi:MAG: type II toxin-antitoxin system VapC family toxin [Planctomycetes bacterium]|nr:type II toxin-antitoxin system VapC family toxin [Planctomycetota bacterium]
MIVLDASAILEVLLCTPAAAAVERRIFQAGKSIHVPHLLDVEVAQVLRRYVPSKQMSVERGQEALQDLLDFPLTRYPHALLPQRAWELRDNLSAYDAVYVALAEALDATLLTRDARLASVQRHRARVAFLE